MGIAFRCSAKILDAREKLSLQVHPPQARPLSSKVNPKLKCGFIGRRPRRGRELFVGPQTRRHAREIWRKKLRPAKWRQCFHRVPVRAGGRRCSCQRSYPCYSGARPGDFRNPAELGHHLPGSLRLEPRRAGDGNPRELHVAQSLASIDFQRFRAGARARQTHRRHFNPTPFHSWTTRCSKVETWRLNPGAHDWLKPKKLQIVAATRGEVEITSGSTSVKLSAGQFSLIPASLERTEVLAKIRRGFIVRRSELISPQVPATVCGPRFFRVVDIPPPFASRI